MTPCHKLSILFHHFFAICLCFVFICSTPLFMVSVTVSTGADPTVHPVAGPLPALAVATGVASVTAALVSALKAIDDSPEYGPLVTGWDDNHLRELCLPSSPRYDPSLVMNDLFKSIFPADEWWSSKDMLYSAVKDFSRIAGFCPSTNHNYIQCSRFGSDSTVRNYSAGPLAQDCTLKFYLRAMHTLRSVQRSIPQVGGRNQKFRIRKDWKKETCIVAETTKSPKRSSCWSHGGRCTPGIQNMVQVAHRSGAYTHNVSSRHIFSLCRQASMKRLTVAQIKGALRDLVPKNTNVTRQQVFNLRVRITRLLPTINENPDYAAFKN